ncbi:MAG: hypothetical protein QM762_10525 [Chryseolinea sp.]
MKAASVNDIKKELSEKNVRELQALCLRLARYKVENKELLTYMLFEADDETGYISALKSEIDEMIEALPQGNVYFVKKALRKMLRIVNKHLKYSGIAQTEVEVRLHCCLRILDKRVPLRSSVVLSNMYSLQLKKIEAAWAKLPEDLQFDYTRDLDRARTQK